jgi:hypothetical protein
MAKPTSTAAPLLTTLDGTEGIVVKSDRGLLIFRSKRSRSRTA